MRVNPTVVRNPANDRVFAKAVADLLAIGVLDADAFQERLRERYPLAVVRPRGLTGEPATWYIYRDGRWTEGGVEADD